MRKQLMVEFNYNLDHIAAHVDKTLIKAFLKMTPEERIRANDKAIQAIMELRDAFKKQKTPGGGSRRTA
ncbi:MAG: hypothetical protein V2B19_08270 [Pseudomonadota bacterium]